MFSVEFVCTELDKRDTRLAVTLTNQSLLKPHTPRQPSLGKMDDDISSSDLASMGFTSFGKKPSSHPTKSYLKHTEAATSGSSKSVPLGECQPAAPETSTL